MFVGSHFFNNTVNFLQIYLVKLCSLAVCSADFFSFLVSVMNVAVPKSKVML